MHVVNCKRRRGILKAVVAGTFVPLMHPLRRVEALSERRLPLFHTHTGNRLDVVYRQGDHYVAEGLSAINKFLGDFRTGDRTGIDPALLDLIHDLRAQLGGEGTFEVISAYRSPKTNEMLRSGSSGVAKNSQHLLGKAIDVRLTGVELKKLRDTALAMQRGGVGYYPQSNFIHVDTGRVRRW
jgi:uncharacterized protein YcbK (DUF882 family)